MTGVIHLATEPSPRLHRELVPPTIHITHLKDESKPNARLPEECTILVTKDLTSRAAWQYKPGFHRRHYCTNCDIFFDVNGAVYAHVPQRRLIVPVYDV